MGINFSAVEGLHESAETVTPQLAVPLVTQQLSRQFGISVATGNGGLIPTAKMKQFLSCS